MFETECNVGSHRFENCGECVYRANGPKRTFREKPINSYCLRIEDKVESEEGAKFKCSMVLDFYSDLSRTLWSHLLNISRQYFRASFPVSSPLDLQKAAKYCPLIQTKNLITAMEVVQILAYSLPLQEISVEFNRFRAPDWRDPEKSNKPSVLHRCYYLCWPTCW